MDGRQKHLEEPAAVNLLHISTSLIPSPVRLYLRRRQSQALALEPFKKQDATEWRGPPACAAFPPTVVSSGLLPAPTQDAVLFF